MLQDAEQGNLILSINSSIHEDASTHLHHGAKMKLEEVPVGRGEDDQMLALVVRLIVLLSGHVGKHDEGLADVIILLDL